MVDIYEMFNDIEIDENEFEEIYVSELEKESIKRNVKEALHKRKLKNNKNSINKKRTSIAAAFFLIFISSVIAVNPALANSVPVIGDLFKRDLISVNQQYINYIDAIGKTKSCEGIDVTFDNAASDDNKLFLSFTIKNNNREIKENFSDALKIPTSMKVNGKSVEIGAAASWNLIDNHTVRVLKRVDWSSNQLPNKMNIDISISQLYGKAGDWGTQFFLNKNKQKEKTDEEKVNSKVDINGIKGTISSVIISPLTVTVQGKGEFSNLPSGSHLDFILLDDRGDCLCWNGYNSKKIDFLSEYNWEATFISNGNMKSITIIPTYSTKRIEEYKKLPAKKLNLNDRRVIDLPIDKNRSICIEDYFIDGNYLIIKYNEKYFGKDSLKQAFDMPIYVTADGVDVKNGEDYKTIKLYNKYNDARENINIFKIGSARNIFIGTYDGSNVKMLKDKSFTVNLKK